MEEQTLYDELVNGLREIEKNVITDLNAGQASGSWMGRIVSNEAPANYLNVQITEIQRTGMISVQADTVVKNKIVGIQKIEIGKEDVMKNGVTSFENKDFLDHLKSNSRSLETVSESITDKGDQRFMVFQTGQKENSLREHYKWLKSNGYNEFPEEDGKASAPAAAPTKKINREIKFNVPKGLTKAEFENTIKFFKENGAKYHVDEKIWTIKESQREKFAQYLNPENMHAAPKNEPQSSEERVRLNIPRYLKPDEFKNLIQYFKKNGAKYEPEEKAWFVEKSKIEVFEKYIKTEENEKDTDTQSWWTPEKEYYQTEEELQKMDPEAAESMRQFFRDHGCILKDSVWIIPGSVFSVESLDPETSIRGIGKKEEFTNKLDQLLREYGYDKGYAYSMDLAEMISKETLHMPPEPEVEVAEAESSTSLNSTATVQTTDREGNYRKGNYVSLHVPDYKTAVYEIKEVCGIKEISGQILAETQDHLILEGKDGKEISVAKKEIYDEMQTSIVEKAMSMDQNVRDQIDLIGNPKLSAPQMDQILNGINDGLQPLLVAQYANPKIPAWQMDIYRYVNNHKAYIQSWTKALSEKPEMLMKAIRDAEKAANYLEYHAEILSKEEYQETLTLHENEETPTPGNTSEKMVEKTANPITREADLKANGYKLTPALKKHMDRLDQLTGRKNSVKDIYKAYKTHDFHGDPETEKTIKSIGKIFQRQEMQIKAVIPER